MSDFESFEVTEYGKPHEIPGRVQGVIKEIVADQVRRVPSVGFQVSFQGTTAKLVYNTYEMTAFKRWREIESTAKTALDESVKNLKKEFKERTGETLNLVEDKSLANNSVHKVSLNERYVCSFWRVFNLE